MSVIIIGGTKGGAGKTTICVNLAVEALKDGKSILLIDCDKQQSASLWAALRDQKIKRQIESGYNSDLKRVPVIQKYGEYTYKEINLLKDKFDHILIDSGGYDSVELRSAMSAADKIYTPLESSQLDIWGIANFIKLVQMAKQFNHNLKATAFINKANTNPRVTMETQTKEALEAIDENIITLSDSIIHERICYKYSIQNGQGISEYDEKNQKAIQEIQSLYRDVFEVAQ